MTALALPAMLAGSACAALQGPAFGVVLVENGAGRPRQSADYAPGPRDEYPMEEADVADTRSIQTAVDRLVAARVKKLVFVPLELSSYGARMDHLRYLIGIRKDPSPDFPIERNRTPAPTGMHAQPLASAPAKSAPKRLDLPLPAVLAQGLDDDPALVEILAERARALSSRGGAARVLLVAEVPEADRKNIQATGLAQSLAAKVCARGAFYACQTLLLPEDAPQEEREKSITELRRTAKALKKNGSLVVLPLCLGASALPARLPKYLDGFFFKYDGADLASDKRFARWTKEQARQAAVLPDMRNFKETGDKHGRRL